MPCTELKAARAPCGRPKPGALAQKPQGARVGFALSSCSVGLNRLRIKRGDSVVLSATDPLSDAVDEGRSSSSRSGRPPWFSSRARAALIYRSRSGRRAPLVDDLLVFVLQEIALLLLSG